MDWENLGIVSASVNVSEIDDKGRFINKETYYKDVIVWGKVINGVTFYSITEDGYNYPKLKAIPTKNGVYYAESFDGIVKKKYILKLAD